MKSKKILFFIFSITLLSTGLWVVLLCNQDPNISSNIVKILFFVSSYILLSGLLTFGLYYLRIHLSNKEIIYSHLITSIRQSMLISLIIVGLLTMSALNLLNVWQAIMLIAAISMIELFFKTKGK